MTPPTSSDSPTRVFGGVLDLLFFRIPLDSSGANPDNKQKKHNLDESSESNNAMLDVSSTNKNKSNSGGANPPIEVREPRKISREDENAFLPGSPRSRSFSPPPVSLSPFWLENPEFHLFLSSNSSNLLAKAAEAAFPVYRSFSAVFKSGFYKVDAVGIWAYNKESKTFVNQYQWLPQDLLSFPLGTEFSVPTIKFCLRD